MKVGKKNTFYSSLHKLYGTLGLNTDITVYGNKGPKSYTREDFNRGVQMPQLGKKR